jgi:tetratricopeptide (TPR) repeat protein
MGDRRCAAAAPRQRGNAIDALAVAVPALRAAQSAGDLHALAAAELSLGQAEQHAGQYQEAIEHIHRVADTSRRAGWIRGEATALSELGDIEIEQGRLKEAVAFLEQGLALFRQIDDIGGKANCRNALGGVALQLGRPEQAVTPLP